MSEKDNYKAKYMTLLQQINLQKESENKDTAAAVPVTQSQQPFYNFCQIEGHIVDDRNELPNFKDLMWAQ